MQPPFSAVVLAAGRSTRMGRDKALLEADGVPLWRRQRDVLSQAGAAEIFLSARPEQKWAYQADGFAAVVHDAIPDCGPIVGITAAIERATFSHIAVLAVDLPCMPAGWFTRLLAACGPGMGAVGQREGFFEPLAAVYPRDMKLLAWETIVRGDYSLQRLVKAASAQRLLQMHEITGEESPWFRNWNEPGEFA